METESVAAGESPVPGGSASGIAATAPGPTAAPDAATRIHDVLGRLFGLPAPVLIRAWDGSESGPPGAPTVVVRSRRAVRRLLWRPDELGLARALVAGEIEVSGSLLEVLETLAPYARSIGARPELSTADRTDLLRTAVALGAVGPQPKPPPEELSGAERRQALADDQTPVERAGRFDDLTLTFASTLLGPSYLCGPGFWADSSDVSAELAESAESEASVESATEVAQLAGADLACRKLALTPGARLLDIGCEWGGFVVHAARDYGVSAVGVTRSAEQARAATKLAESAGVADRVHIVHGSWRSLASDAGFDAVTGSGLGDFIGAAEFGEQVSALGGMLVPGGRLLLDQVCRKAGPVAPERSFVDAYVAPGAQLPRLGEIADAVEAADLEVCSVDSLRVHQSATLRAWTSALESRLATTDGHADLPGVTPGRLRVWHLYLAASTVAFDAGRIGMHQLLATRPTPATRPGEALPS
ncbi:class I SAM-dependent methyltransferase [Flindersiella endophytica]